MNAQIILEHLFMVLVAGFFSILIGVPLGIISYQRPGPGKVILKIVDVLQTIPALALLGIIMVFAGAGKTTVIVGITLYSLLPVVQNTCIGLQQVDSGVKDAARGMGMSPSGRLFKVELPLAFPTMFTGIRIAIVNAIGTAVFAAYVGGGGIGGVLNQAIRNKDMSTLMKGTASLMIIAVILDLSMGFFEKHVKKSHGNTRQMMTAAIVLGAAVLIMIPVGFKGNSSSNQIVLYDGNYSETQIMHRMVKYLVEDQTDYDVTIKDQMTQVNNFKCMVGKNPSCDMMISYDGTVLTTFMHKDTSDVPSGTTMWKYVDNYSRKHYDSQLIGKLGFDNTYAIAVTREVADKYNLKKVSDLKKVAPQLTFGAESEFFSREGSMKYQPFVEFYGLHFKNTVSVDTSLKYNAIENGSFHVTEVYATDGLNKKAGLVTLEDDRHFFPDYYGTFFVRNDALRRFPKLKKVLSQLNGQISNEDMVNMTYQVDVEGKSVDTVARNFLIKKGLISGEAWA